MEGRSAWSPHLRSPHHNHLHQSPTTTEWILGNGPLELFAQSLLDADDPRISFAFLSNDDVRFPRACVPVSMFTSDNSYTSKVEVPVCVLCVRFINR